MSLWLTPEELQELTGYRQPLRQLRWLQRTGVNHYVRADGRPMVPRNFTQPAAPVPQPDFAALERKH